MIKNMNTIDAANFLRTKNMFWNEHEYRNGEIVGKYPFICCKCHTNLQWNYQESETYLVRCSKCETITIIQGRSPYEAMGKVGIKENENL